MTTIVDINWVAIVVAALVNMVIGFVWYSKLLFADAWGKELGKSEAELKAAGSNPTVYVWPLAAALVMAYVLTHFVSYANATTVTDGAVTGFWIWLGFIVTTNLSMKVFEGRSWKLFWIGVGYYLVTLVVTGGILATWR